MFHIEYFILFNFYCIFYQINAQVSISLTEKILTELNLAFEQ